MYDLKRLEDAKKITGAMRIFETESGKEVIRFLEQTCGWYDSVFDNENRDYILVKAGRREVLATIKTLTKLSAEEIVQMATTKEQNNVG